MASPTNPPPLVEQPRPAVRAVVSVLVAFHVLAVFIGPFAMPPASSELASKIALVFRPYVEPLCLANGYRFFAPEPGPSHLVRYEITLPDGTREVGSFPDRNKNKPRLLYHRYFMMSEFINTVDDAQNPSPLGKAFAKGYAEHLADAFQAQTVKLYLRLHYVPRMSEARQGMRLDDKVLFDERPLYSYSKEADADAGH
jgi:hypothetical protein